MPTVAGGTAQGAIFEFDNFPPEPKGSFKVGARRSVVLAGQDVVGVRLDAARSSAVNEGGAAVGDDAGASVIDSVTIGPDDFAHARYPVCSTLISQAEWTTLNG